MKKTKLRKVSKVKSSKLKKELQKLVNEYVRNRDKVCQARMVDGKNCGGCLQASHIFPEGAYQGLRFDPENIIALCMMHHLYWWHKNPIQANEWVKTKLGETKYEALKIKSQQFFIWDTDSLAREIQKYKQGTINE